MGIIWPVTFSQETLRQPPDRHLRILRRSFRSFRRRGEVGDRRERKTPNEFLSLATIPAFGAGADGPIAYCLLLTAYHSSLTQLVCYDISNCQRLQVNLGISIKVIKAGLDNRDSVGQQFVR
jgi:hypothetical protein